MEKVVQLPLTTPDVGGLLSSQLAETTSKEAEEGNVAAHSLLSSAAGAARPGVLWEISDSGDFDTRRHGCKGVRKRT